MTIMQVQHMRTAIVAAWVLAWCAVAFLVDVTSVTGWMTLVAVAVLPPIVLLRMWRAPAQTMSESIRNVLK